MILFVCSQGRIRSRTAELLCIHGGLEARSCGTDATAMQRVNNELLWAAESVFCMERTHSKKICEFVGAERKVVESLGIEDIYSLLGRDLITMLINAMHYRDERIHAAMVEGYAEILKRGLYDDLINQKTRQSATGLFGEYGG